MLLFRMLGAPRGRMKARIDRKGHLFYAQALATDQKFSKRDLVTEDVPVVAVNQNSSNPHYEPGPSLYKEIIIFLSSIFLLSSIALSKNTPSILHNL